MTRAEIEAIVIGKQIAKIRWSDTDDFGHATTENRIDGFDFTDGALVSVSGSGQVDITAVWLFYEEAVEESRECEPRDFSDLNEGHDD